MRNRFLIAGLLALGVAACGDDVEVISPAPPVVPPPPPVTATMAPASASVAVGNSVVFAVNASGGVAGESATWTCSSSNTGIATASSTSAGCQATGVVAGSVTITAAVSKSGETVNVGAQLTVTSDEVVGPAGDPAFIVISSIGTGAEEGIQPAQGWGGRLDVGVNIERGDQTLERVSLLVDGEVVNYQSFGGNMGMAPPEDEAAEQAVHTFTLTVDTAEYDEATGTPKYMNGEHVLSAELQIAGGMMSDGMMGHETISSNAQTVDFYNADGLHVTADFPGNSAMNPETGDLWYGGPDSGDFTIVAVPVTYSGGAAAESVTLRSVCGGDAITDDEAPFEFTLDCDESGPVSPVFSASVGGEALLNLKPVNSTIFPLNLDFVGPPAPHFNVNPNKRQAGWVNATVDFLGKFHSTRNKDGWLVYNDDEKGVSGYQPVLRFSSTTPSVVDGALAATPNALPTAPTKANAACVIATAVDLLGNESKLPSAGKACTTAADYAVAVQALKDARGADDPDEDAIEDALGDIPAGIRAGLDVTAPTIDFSGTSPKNNDRKLTSEFQLQVADPDPGQKVGYSGLHTDPVLANVQIRNAKNEVICGDDDADDMSIPGNETILGECKANTEGLSFDNTLGLVTTTGVVADGTIGYYTVTAAVRDKAGNYSEAVSRVALNDAAGAVSLIGGAYDAKKAVYNLIVSVTDNFSVRDYYVALTFPSEAAGTTLPSTLRVVKPVAVDAYNSALTKSVDAGGTYNAVLALQKTSRSGEGNADQPYVHGIETSLVDLTSVGIHARDQSDQNKGYTSPAPSFAASGQPTTGFPSAAAVAEAPIKGGIASFVFETDTDEYDVDDVVELTAEVTGRSRDGKAAVIGDNPNTNDVTETDYELNAVVEAIEFLNPFKRVDFYATGGDELRFIASASASGVESKPVDEDEDDNDENRETTDNEITFSYETVVNAADLYAAVQDSGKGTYTGSIVAIGVSVTADDLPTMGGVGLVSQAEMIEVEK